MVWCGVVGWFEWARWAGRQAGIGTKARKNKRVEWRSAEQKQLSKAVFLCAWATWQPVVQLLLTLQRIKSKENPISFCVRVFFAFCFPCVCLLIVKWVDLWWRNKD